jgi:hypothetical protein
MRLPGQTSGSEKRAKAGRIQPKDTFSFKVKPKGDSLKRFGPDGFAPPKFKVP